MSFEGFLLVFLKPLKDLKFADIEHLKSNKTCESDILDYKEDLLKDEDLLKHVSSFANTQGGFLIFGVKETGRGGYPEEIMGIDRGKVNKERMEQIILSNIQPRLDVKIQEIDHQESTKALIVIEIPNSYLKPHLSRQGDRFYKRYNFEAMPMTEIEVSDAYKRRFTGYQEIESYLLRLKLNIDEFKPSKIVGQIVVIPTILSRMIETSNVKEFDWIKSLNFSRGHPYLPSENLTPSTNGIVSIYNDKSYSSYEELEIHRNGCIEYKDYYDELSRETLYFQWYQFCIDLMHTLQFASNVYQRYNYFGDVRIVCNLYRLENSVLPLPSRQGIGGYGYDTSFPCQVKELSIGREFSTTFVESKYEFITSRIANDIFNSYHLWKCPYFDDEGNFKQDFIR